MRHSRNVFVPLVGEGPTYLKLYRGLRDAIVDGRLAANTALPSTRELAEKMELSRNTVLRAYEQLIAEGFANGRQGGGTFVAEHVVHRAAPIETNVPVELGPGGMRIVAAMVSNPLLDAHGAALPPRILHRVSTRR